VLTLCLEASLWHAIDLGQRLYLPIRRLATLILELTIRLVTLQQFATLHSSHGRPEEARSSWVLASWCGARRVQRRFYTLLRAGTVRYYSTAWIIPQRSAQTSRGVVCRYSNRCPAA